VETVVYTNRFDYTHTPDGKTLILLPLQISSDIPPTKARDVDCYLDLIAYRSLFNGQIATLLGIDLSKGNSTTYKSTFGITIEATLHKVYLTHPVLGSFLLEVGFSKFPITRNLLSRDFFNLLQIGFREHDLRFFIKPQQ
jgi:hypothetical protein